METPKETEAEVVLKQRRFVSAGLRASSRVTYTYTYIHFACIAPIGDWRWQSTWAGRAASCGTGTGEGWKCEGCSVRLSSGS